MFPVRLLFILLLLTLTCVEAPARLWKTVTGQTFEAEFIRRDGGNGIFSVKEKEYPYPLNRLSVADRLFIGRTVNQQTPQAASATPDLTSPTPAEPLAGAEPSPSAAAGGPALAGQSLKLGGETEVEIPMTDPDGLREVQKAYAKPSDQARLLIAVPEGFDPAKNSYPLLIVSSTADGAASSIGTAHQYVRDALEKGFVVLAVDGQFGKPGNGDSIEFRWALVSAALAAVDKEWPQAKEWPLATAGVSGGGGYASHQALKLAQQRAHLVGLFLAVTKWNPTNFKQDFNRVPFSIIRDLPIFLSAGDNDEVADKESTADSYKAMVKKGFKKVRFEQFDGGHQLNHAHLQAALDWFRGEIMTKPE